MDGDIDYSTYTLQQLREAEAGVNQERFPINHARIRRELGMRGVTLTQLEAPRAEPVPSRLMPPTMTLAVRFLWGSLWLGIANSIIHWDYLSALAPVVFSVLILVLVFLVSAWLFHKISLGRNWARITFLVMSILSIGLSLAQPSQMLEGPLLSVVLSLVVGLLQLVALVLLFVPQSRPWFQRVAG